MTRSFIDDIMMRKQSFDCILKMNLFLLTDNVNIKDKIGQ